MIKNEMKMLSKLYPTSQKNDSIFVTVLEQLREDSVKDKCDEYKSERELRERIGPPS